MEKFYKESYKKYLAMAKRSIYNVDDAQDVTAYAFEKALRSYSPSVKNIDPWFYGIMRNALYDYHKQRKEYHKYTFNAGMVNLEQDPCGNVEDRVASREQLDKVASVLKETDGGIPYDIFAEGATYKEIAAKYCISVRTVKRKMKHYRQLVEELGGCNGISCSS